MYRSWFLSFQLFITIFVVYLNSESFGHPTFSKSVLCADVTDQKGTSTRVERSNNFYLTEGKSGLIPVMRTGRSMKNPKHTRSERSLTSLIPVMRTGRSLSGLVPMMRTGRSETVKDMIQNFDHSLVEEQAFSKWMQYLYFLGFLDHMPLAYSADERSQIPFDTVPIDLGLKIKEPFNDYQQ